jgi:hypothetical protein
MATYAGNGGAVYVSSNAVAEVKDFSLEITANTQESTVMNPSDTDDAGWVMQKVTTKSWTASVNAIWDDNDANGQGALTEGAAVALNLYPSGNTSGKKYWQGDAIVTGVSKNVSVDGLVEASLSVVGDGHITEETVS